MPRFLILGALTLGSVSGATAPSLLPRAHVLPLRTLEPSLTQSVDEPHVPTLVASGAFAALLATPTALLAGAGLGSLSNNLYGAVVPSLLTALLVPPLAVVLTEWVLAERSGKGRFRLIPTLLVAVVGQAAVLGAGILLGVNGTSSSGAAVVTLASAVVLPAVTTAMLKVTERPPAFSVPVASGSF